MLELTKGPITDGFADISLRVPAEQAADIAKKLKKFFELVNITIRERNPEGEELYTLDEVFPDLHQGSAIRRLRMRGGLTQKRLAEIIGVNPSHISEMEHGKRPIGKEMARRLAKALRVDYRVFL